MMSASFAGPVFSGSTEAEPDPKDDSMVFRMPNLTPDPQTGHITAWTEDQFVARFRAGRKLRNDVDDLA